MDFSRILEFFSNSEKIHFYEIHKKDADSVLRITHESSAKKFAGFPSFCILEEFDRYTGYYWLKTNDPTKGKIVYEGLSQTLFATFRPITDNIPVRTVRKAPFEPRKGC